MRELSALGNADADEEMPAAEAAPGRHLDVLRILPPDFQSAWPFWEHLAERLLLAHQQVFRFLSGGSRRHALLMSPTTVYQPVTVPQWQATWQLEGMPPALPRARTSLGPELFMDLPDVANHTVERWYGRWCEANSPKFLHIYPQCAAGEGPYTARFSSAIGLVTVYVPDQIFLDLLHTGAWDQPLLTPQRMLEDAAAGSPILIDFQAMILVRPFSLPLSYLYRVLRLPDP